MRKSHLNFLVTINFGAKIHNIKKFQLSRNQKIIVLMFLALKFK